MNTNRALEKLMAGNQRYVTDQLVHHHQLGDLFVIRVAGNLLDDAILGSIEYAVKELGTSLVSVDRK